MADLTVVVTFRATVGGKAFSWSRTGTVTDIEAAATVGAERNLISGGANTISNDPTYLSSGDSPHSYTGAAFILIAGTGTSGGILSTAYDPSSNPIGYQTTAHGMPLILYAGYDFNGAMSKGASATGTPASDIGVVVTSPILGPNKFQALAAYKPIS